MAQREEAFHTPDEVKAACQEFRDLFGQLKAQISTVLVGQESVIEGVLICLFAGGHALLEGVPGLGKTLLVRTLAETLHLPFIVLATQNPIEQEGTYPLPEAQLDRFMFKIVVGYSSLKELMIVLDRTTGAETPTPRRVVDGPKILELQRLVRGVIVAPHVKEYAARLVLATHPEGEMAAGGATGPTNKYIRCGASPRAAQSLILGAKVKAVTDGRYHVSVKDIKDVAMQALRHRILLNFEAEADRMSTDSIVKQIVDLTPTEPQMVGV